MGPELLLVMARHEALEHSALSTSVLRVGARVLEFVERRGGRTIDEEARDIDEQYGRQAN